MNTDETTITDERASGPDAGYVPPAVTFLGTLTELTQKTVGAADGTTFLGLDIGS